MLPFIYFETLTGALQQPRRYGFPSTDDLECVIGYKPLIAGS
jgi:hypothetical protein